MPLAKLDFLPGVNKENTPYTNEGGWVDSDKIRFRSGKPEKIGGWEKYDNRVLIGITRALHTFRTLDGTIYLAIATNEKIYLESGGSYYDITPVRETQALTNPFTTTAASATITVTDVAHGADDGAYITITGSAAVDGIPDTEINAEHKITYVDADTYTITVTTPATTGGVTGGGASVSIEYQVNPGPVSGIYQYGWGAGPWGAGTWGTIRSSVGVALSPRLWNFANWGEDLIMNYNGGGVFIWDATNVNTRATQITQAPHKVNHIAVTSDRHLVCFGCNVPGTSNALTDLDTLQIRWCDQENYTDWTVTSTNTAGDKLITNGTEILGVAKTENQVLVWTDDSMESMQFVGPPYTFAFAQVGAASGLAAPKAWAAYDNVIYWMGDNAFYVFQGGTKVLPCTVQKYVFGSLDVQQQLKTFAVLNRENHEVTWFYPATSQDVRYLNGAITASDTTIVLDTTAGLPMSGVFQIDSEVISYTGKTDYSLTGCTRGERGTVAAAHADEASGSNPDNDWSKEPYHYVTYNVVDNLWWVGRLERTAMIDKGSLQYPIAAGPSGYLYEHEKGTDADGGPLSAFVQSADFDLGEGDQLMFIHRVLPDFEIEGSLDLKMRTRYYPLSTEVKEVIGTVTPSTTKIDTRIRGRQLALRIESDTLGDYWKYGATRIEQRPDGRR